VNQTTINEKSKLVNEISEEIKASVSFVVAEYRGLSVAEITKLRDELIKVNSSLKIYKNSSISRASSQLGYEDFANDLSGPNAFIFSKDNPLGGAKVLNKFSKRNPKLKLKSGIVDGKVYNGETLAQLAELPSKNDLIAMFLSCIQAPIVTFALTVKAIAEKKES